jgi:RHS repeat-associated protein
MMESRAIPDVPENSIPILLSRSTGKERDNETGLDNFLFRQFASPVGRWLSPDPETVGAVIELPQSWNGYSYVMNTPLRFIDPLGLMHKNDDGYWVGDKDGEVNENGDVWDDKNQRWETAEERRNRASREESEKKKKEEGYLSSQWEWVKNTWFTGSVFIPVIPIMAADVPVGDFGIQVNVVGNWKKKTMCVGAGPGFQLPPGGRSPSFGWYNTGNLGNVKGISEGWSGNGGAILPIGSGYQATTSYGQGTVGGPNFGFPGASGAATVSVCK